MVSRNRGQEVEKKRLADAAADAEASRKRAEAAAQVWQCSDAQFLVGIQWGLFCASLSLSHTYTHLWPWSGRREEAVFRRCCVLLFLLLFAWVCVPGGATASCWNVCPGGACVCLTESVWVWVVV